MMMTSGCFLILISKSGFPKISNRNFKSASDLFEDISIINYAMTTHLQAEY